MADAQGVLLWCPEVEKAHGRIVRTDGMAVTVMAEPKVDWTAPDHGNMTIPTTTLTVRRFAAAGRQFAVASERGMTDRETDAALTAVLSHLIDMDPADVAAIEVKR